MVSPEDNMPSPEGEEGARLVIEPIGFVRNALSTKVEAARQPCAAEGAPARIELLPGRNFEHALEDVARWKWIWVIFWFHRNPGWRPKVLPPRSVTGRKGVFATRSPHRPNPIGMSVVRLERVDGLTLYVLDADMLDGTPVLDIKPYVAYTDAIPDAGNGWLDDSGRAANGGVQDPVNAYTVTFDRRAVEQANWIEARTGLALAERIRSTLALGPAPHPYRRIRRIDEQGMQLSVKEWRIRFSVEGRDVRVVEIASGFRASQLDSDANDDALRVHREFRDKWS